MTEHEYTAGPWNADGPDVFGDWNILHPADSLAVAAVVSNMREAHIVAANARLVAAAPEMLAALKSAVEISDLNWHSGERRPPETQKVYDQCVAAIAKAKAHAQ